MVYPTNFLLRIKPHELGRHLKRPFIDKLRVYVKSGDGGSGLPKMGGIGGNGGSIYIQGKGDLTLKKVYSNNLHKRYIAQNGDSSKKLKLFANSAPDLVIDVPCGVAAMTDSGSIIGEVNEEGEKLLIAKGGAGASPINNYKAEKGQAFSVNFDLKLIADVGLIGFPNAGKSTLLSLVSRARPKIANYPFTTLNPQLGTIEYDDGRIITMADLPGLIEGAHYNRGMGHKFLKHVARTKLHLFMVDINGFQLNPKFESRSAFDTMALLNKELEMFDSGLVSKPAILALNKMDSENAQARFDEFMEKYENYEKSIESLEEGWRPIERVKFDKIIKLSAKENTNADELCAEVRDLIDRIDLDDKTANRRDHTKQIEQIEEENDEEYEEIRPENVPKHHTLV